MTNSFSPMTVSEKAGIEDTNEQILNRWAKYDLLPDDKQEVITSMQAETIIRDLGQRNRLTAEQTSELARIVRDLFFGMLPENGVAGEIIKRIPVIDMQNAQSVASEIVSKIYKAKAEPQPLRRQEREVNVVELQPKHEQIELNEALKKYPKIQFQLLTSRPLALNGFPEPAQPNVANWIQNYQQTLGFEPHTTINRANFIFHSDNGKKLSEQDRNKLMYILKSFDDKKLIQIDSKMQQIIFPKNLGDIFNEETRKEVGSVQPQQETMQFNPGQTQFRREQQSMNIAPRRETLIQSQETSEFPQTPQMQEPVQATADQADEYADLRREALGQPPVEEQLMDTVSPTQGINQGALENIYSPKTVPKPVDEAPEFNLEDFAVGSRSTQSNKDDLQNVSFSSPQKLPYEND